MLSALLESAVARCGRSGDVLGVAEGMEDKVVNPLLLLAFGWLEFFFFFFRVMVANLLLRG